MQSELRIRINGDERVFDGPLVLRELLDRLALPEHGLAVERNREIVPRREHATTRLRDGDVLEIVTLVGGG